MLPARDDTEEELVGACRPRRVGPLRDGSPAGITTALSILLAGVKPLSSSSESFCSLASSAADSESSVSRTPLLERVNRDGVTVDLPFDLVPRLVTEHSQQVSSKDQTIERRLGLPDPRVIEAGVEAALLRFAIVIVLSASALKLR